MADARNYSDADVRAIIDRALANSTTADGVSHTDLLAIGEQIGVSKDAMTRAAHELREEQLRTEAERALLSRRRRWLGWHAALFALINALAFAVNFLTTPGEWWSLFSIVPWALALALHAGLNAAIPVSEAALSRERRRRTSASSSPRLRIEATSPTAPATTIEDDSHEDERASQTRRA